MWAFLSRRLRTWLVLAVAVPLGAKVLRRAGEKLEERQGPTTVSKGLRNSGEFLQGLGRRGNGRRR
jgi:hypothetical protein